MKDIKEKKVNNLECKVIKQKIKNVDNPEQMSNNKTLAKSMKFLINFVEEERNSEASRIDIAKFLVTTTYEGWKSRAF